MSGHIHFIIMKMKCRYIIVSSRSLQVGADYLSPIMALYLDESLSY